MELRKDGYMKTKSDFDNEEVFIEDRTAPSYEKAISRIDEENLKKIANDMGIKYIHMTKEKDRNLALNDIKAKAVQNAENSENSDIYFVFVLPLLVLLIYEYILYKRQVFV